MDDGCTRRVIFESDSELSFYSLRPSPHRQRRNRGCDSHIDDRIFYHDDGARFDAALYLCEFQRAGAGQSFYIRIDNGRLSLDSAVSRYVMDIERSDRRRNLWFRIDLAEGFEHIGKRVPCAILEDPESEKNICFKLRDIQ